MPLNLPQLKQDIKEAIEASQQTQDPAIAQQIFIDKLAESIHDYVKTGTVTSTPGNVT